MHATRFRRRERSRTPRSAAPGRVPHPPELAAVERHGNGIIQDIQSRGDTAVPDVGTTYRALARMVEQRLIKAAARRASAGADDERRNDDRITDKGLRLARSEARRLEMLTRAARIGGLLPRAAKRRSRSGLPSGVYFAGDILRGLLVGSRRSVR